MGAVGLGLGRVQRGHGHLRVRHLPGLGRVRAGRAGHGLALDGDGGGRRRHRSHRARDGPARGRRGPAPPLAGGDDGGGDRVHRGVLLRHAPGVLPAAGRHPDRPGHRVLRVRGGAGQRDPRADLDAGHDRPDLGDRLGSGLPRRDPAAADRVRGLRLGGRALVRDHGGRGAEHPGRGAGGRGVVPGVRDPGAGGRAGPGARAVPRRRPAAGVPGGLVPCAGVHPGADVARGPQHPVVPALLGGVPRRRRGGLRLRRHPGHHGLRAGGLGRDPVRDRGQRGGRPGRLRGRAARRRGRSAPSDPRLAGRHGPRGRGAVLRLGHPRVLGRRAGAVPVRGPGAVGLARVPGPAHHAADGRRGVRAVRHHGPRGRVHHARPRDARARPAPGQPGGHPRDRRRARGRWAAVRPRHGTDHAERGIDSLTPGGMHPSASLDRTLARA
ncbi:hypothetical protein MICRO116_620009 [Micrococcus sp. 116]|nr:hypothetical protein MICRO116_620009 [Micrococcus sp. 116]